MEHLRLMWEHLQNSWQVVPLLAIVGVGLMAWFPGHNAKRHAHPQAGLVSGAAWWLVVIDALFIFSDVHPIVTGPLFIALWIAVLVWSYGKREALVRASTRPGFEVLVQPAPAVEAVSSAPGRPTAVAA